ncbi:extracellular solute-binding protein [Roseinatronobacter sp. S2]|uniref:extracellular solute-binding protein n=1 Tax=Roseinatronobacter sp. S2 TaxID=3035471 RepID=UPI00240EA64E|nr:extracellular solute-binding protein [Roseinatronobacter sp. S2]WFE77075.1 extracellular solute-binding protein [Roseinatronobacter sp. S2]
MRRRDILQLGLVGLGGISMGQLLRPVRAFGQATTTLNLYTGSDSNISDFLANTVKPAFERVHSGVNVNVVIAREGGGTQAMAERALAALRQGADPQMEMIESFDPFLPVGAVDEGLWVNLAEAGLENYQKIDPLWLQTPHGMPYRGSQVVLAYDTTRLDPADAPRTWEQLETWIRDNPGAFTYNRPDRGGSGGNFVRRAILEANGRDPSLFRVDNFDEAVAAERLSGGFDILAGLVPYLFDGGSYAAGNTQSIQLLANGAVTMVPAWSDQALQAVSLGVLPETTGFMQLQDLSLGGSSPQAVVPTNTPNLEHALALADFMLSEEMQVAVVEEIGGFPAVAWEHLPARLQERFADVAATSVFSFPGGDWAAAVTDGWYREVAPNIPRD